MIGFQITDLVGLGGIPIVLALVALIKTTFCNLKERYYPGICNCKQDSIKRWQNINTK